MRISDWSSDVCSSDLPHARSHFSGLFPDAEPAPRGGVERPFTCIRRTAMHAHEMISTHPQVRGNTNDSLIRCIEECFDCAQSCTSCADACLGAEMVAQLTQCICLNLDCADICTAPGHIASRRSGPNEPIIKSVMKE